MRTLRACVAGLLPVIRIMLLHGIALALFLVSVLPDQYDLIQAAAPTTKQAHQAYWAAVLTDVETYLRVAAGFAGLHFAIALAATARGERAALAGDLLLAAICVSGWICLTVAAAYVLVFNMWF